MKKRLFSHFSSMLCAVMMLCVSASQTYAQVQTYAFDDFLPLNERKAGRISINGTPSTNWVVLPNWNGTSQTQVQFRELSDPTVWPSDIWEARNSGPLGIPFWYLNSHVSRQYLDETQKWLGTIDIEFEIEPDKTILHRFINGIEYINDVSAPGGRGIPYFRREWNNSGTHQMRHIVKNWYYVKNAQGQRARRIFHQQEFIHTRLDTVVGPEWTGANPSRQFIELREAYWDHEFGKTPVWRIGSGDIGSNGEPNGNNVVYGRTRWHAYKTGSETGVMAFKSQKTGNPKGTSITWNY